MAFDPYLDPETGVLKNLIGAKDTVTLDLVEGDLSFARRVQLFETPVAATGDLAELRAIHRQLFQDVYEWAGEPRTVDISKPGDGNVFFLPWRQIEAAAMHCARELREDAMLRGLSREHFIDRLSTHYDAWNHVHPFREGNGRVQRVFWDRVAADAGWILDWQPVRGEINDEACRIAAVRQDLGPLREMFGRIVQRDPVT